MDQETKYNHMLTGNTSKNNRIDSDSKDRKESYKSKVNKKARTVILISDQAAFILKKVIKEGMGMMFG